jgi:NitT/TauT family transport system ATP-binding protein
MTEAARLSFEGIRHVFRGSQGAGPVEVIGGVDFSVGAGQFVAVVGPSGCGKSTLLQMAAGLLRPSSGSVSHDGRRIVSVNRALGFVPQQALLFPWKTLAENVGLPLELRGVAGPERRDRVARILEEVGLQGFAEHYPHQLSGGMQKRGAIARTLVYGPDVIVMDEPFGALDAQTRMVMQNDLQALAARQKASVLFVTHDIAEAILLADEVVVLSRRPATVIARVKVTLARPRDVFEPYRNSGFQEAYAEVWSLFRSEIAGARAA